MANNIDLTIFAPKPSFRRFRCFAWLIQLRQRTALSPLKRSCSSRFAASEPRTVLSFLCAFPVGFFSVCAPLSRFFSISRRSSLMAPLCQGSCPPQRTEGLSPWGRGQWEGGRRPLPQSPHRTSSSSCSGVSLGLFGKPKRSSFSRIRGLHRSAPRCLL